MRLRITMFLFGCVLLSVGLSAQEKSEVSVHLVARSAHAKLAPAVVWLEPLAGTVTSAFTPREHYTLLQKNRTFNPHLLVVPVGSVVQFPNEDPFFHNVFSLFDGKRFDLGLYEAGSKKAVTFSREGVSYIFCNIHPEMSAVVIALSTPLYTVGDSGKVLSLNEVPYGDYRFHIWMEGVPQASLNSLVKTVHVEAHALDLGEVRLPLSGAGSPAHTDEYGHPYRPAPKSAY